MIRVSLFFTYAALLHLTWAGLLLISHTATHATTTAYLYSVVPDRYILSGLLMVASAMSLWVVYRADSYSFITLLLFVPQAIFVLLAATGAVQAVLTGEFADGVRRSHWFIAADQAPPILIACLHQWVLIRAHTGVLRLKWRG